MAEICERCSLPPERCFHRDKRFLAEWKNADPRDMLSISEKWYLRALNREGLWEIEALSIPRPALRTAAQRYYEGRKDRGEIDPLIKIHRRTLWDRILEEA